MYTVTVVNTSTESSARVTIGNETKKVAKKTGSTDGTAVFAKVVKDAEFNVTIEAEKGKTITVTDVTCADYDNFSDLVISNVSGNVIIKIG